MREVRALEERVSAVTGSTGNRQPHPKSRKRSGLMTNLRSVYRVGKDEGLQDVEGADDGLSRPSTALKGAGLPDRPA